MEPKESSNTPSLLLTSGENLEIFSLIWLDYLSTNDTNENIDIQQQLRSIINYLKIFENIDDCEEYIRSLSKDNRIVLLINEKFALEITTRIHELRQVISIYIYSTDNDKDYEWIQQYKKVRISYDFFAVFINYKPRVQSLTLLNTL
jgi:hypothetical protein